MFLKIEIFHEKGCVAIIARYNVDLFLKDSTKDKIL